MAKHASGQTSSQTESYQPRHESTGNSPFNALRILARIFAGRAAGRN